jgi:hypothetical protein
VTDSAPYEVVQRRRRLGPGEAAACHHERQHRATRLCVRDDRCLLQDVDHVIADAHRVGERLERQRMLGQSGDSPEVGDVAERHHEMIEGELVGLRREPGAEPHHTPIDVHALDLAHEQLSVRKQLAQRTDRVENADVAGDHLCQHWLEYEVVLAVDQRHLDRRALRGQPFQMERGVHAAEAAAQDDHACGLRARARVRGWHSAKYPRAAQAGLCSAANLKSAERGMCRPADFGLVIDSRHARVAIAGRDTQGRGLVNAREILF